MDPTQPSRRNEQDRSLAAQKRRSIWAAWLRLLSRMVPARGAREQAAGGHQRILGLLLEYSVSVNVMDQRGAVWGRFVEALFDLSEQALNRRETNIYLNMLDMLLRAHASPNATYRRSTVAKVFFAGLQQARGLQLPDVRQQLDSDLSFMPIHRLEFLARMFQGLIDHGANPSCVPSDPNLYAIFPARLAEPLCQLVKQKRAEARPASMLDWFWWPWRAAD